MPVVPCYLEVRKMVMFWRIWSNTVIAEIRNGYGRHIYVWPTNIMLEKVRRWLRVFVVFELMFHTATTLSKYSMSVIPPRPNDNYRRAHLSLTGL